MINIDFPSRKHVILIQKLDFESVWAKHHDAYIKNECIKSMERFYKSAFIRTRRGTFFQTLRTRLWSVFCQVLKSEKSQNKNVLTIKRTPFSKMNILLPKSCFVLLEGKFISFVDDRLFSLICCDQITLNIKNI